MPGSEVLCAGEVLWDALPPGLFLGGAPLNVACHLRAAGLPAAMVSRVGADRLGTEAISRLAGYGVSTDLIQVDPALPTGFVQVMLNDAGDPTYEILAPAAWDAIEATDALLERAADARALVFGTLAQREATSRNTIARLWEMGALKVFDANLRPPYDDRATVDRSLRHADVVKVTEPELSRLATWFDLPGAIPAAESSAAGSLAAGRSRASPARRGAPSRPGRATPTSRSRALPPPEVPMVRTVAALAESFGCGTVCVTRGRDGAGLWRDGRWTEQSGFDVEVRNTVGAGDAFLAVLLAGLLGGTDDGTVLRHATLMGAYITTQFGAVPADQSATVPLRPTPPA